MNTPVTYHTSADYDVLVETALKHVSKLAGDVWTNHNAADPGRTILEVLSFAIADLSYRTSFEVKDIVTGYKGDKTSAIDLRTADLVLPSHPVTGKRPETALT